MCSRMTQELKYQNIHQWQCKSAFPSVWCCTCKWWTFDWDGDKELGSDVCQTSLISLLNKHEGAALPHNF